MEESHYFLHRMMVAFHLPDEYRWNLSTFLQALRSVTLTLQSELNDRDGFSEWYAPWRDKLKADPLLRRIVEGRNTVVHKGQLKRRSKVQLGLFRGYQLKLGLGTELNVDVPSHDLLVRFIGSGVFGITRPGDDGEQLGVHRIWIADDLCESDEDITEVCAHALGRISEVVSAAHDFCGSQWEPIPEEAASHQVGLVNTLFETDLDAGVVSKAKSKARRQNAQMRRDARRPREERATAGAAPAK